MALFDVCTAILARLTVLPDADQAVLPPPQLPDDRMILVYPNVGTSRPYAHASEAGRPVVLNADTIVVEVHRKLAMDQMVAGIQWATPMLDAVRNAIWLGYHADDLGGTVTQLDAITTETFGEMGWGTDPTFGFRLTLAVQCAEEVL